MTSETDLRDKRIVIVGAGPTGLGCAHRLMECGIRNFLVLERQSHPGGLASSFVDEQGFTWDVGGHVQFSHYQYFDDLMDRLLQNDWLWHKREILDLDAKHLHPISVPEQYPPSSAGRHARLPERFDPSCQP